MDKYDRSDLLDSSSTDLLYKGLICKVTKIDVWVLVTKILGKIKDIDEYDTSGWEKYGPDTQIVEVASFEDLEKEYGSQVVEKLFENKRQRNEMLAERSQKNKNIGIYAIPQPRLECWEKAEK